MLNFNIKERMGMGQMKESLRRKAVEEAVKESREQAREVLRKTYRDGLRDGTKLTLENLKLAFPDDPGLALWIETVENNLEGYDAQG